MIGLYLLAAHLVGDFVLANRWQAAAKIKDRAMRAQHVWGYALPFVPLLLWRYLSGASSGWSCAAFMWLLLLMHYATDSYRFRSTLGDVVQWRNDRRIAPDVAVTAWVDHLYGDADPVLSLRERTKASYDLAEGKLRWPPPNPWAPISLMIDQTLHVCQLAVLGGIFLS